MFLGITAGVVASTHTYGAYEVAVWAPLGVVLVCAAAVLVATGHRPTRLIWAAAGALVLLGAWSLLSTAWGGLPHDSWRLFDQEILAAAALVAGSSLASRPRYRAIALGAVLAGLTVHALEMLARLAIGNHPDDWLQDRFVQGPVGYHNAQGLLFAIGVPLALWATGSSHFAARIMGGASGGLLLGALLLTQSRAALIAAGLGVVVQLLFTRTARSVCLVALFGAGALALGFALRNVDAALLEGTPAEKLDAFRRFGLWTALVALALGALAIYVPPRLATRALAALTATALVAALTVAVVREDLFPSSDFTLSRLVSDEPPKASPGQTRIVSLSLNGRKEAWRVARTMSSDAPVIGAGQGQFARYWTRERRLVNLYILQPHSIELELLSELGIIGLGLFGVFGLLAATALIRDPSRGLAAAGLGTATVVVAQASVDWTWSFPGIVAPALVVVGVAAGAGPQRSLGWPARGALAVAALAALVSLGAPYLGQAELSRAANARDDPDRAWNLAETARKLDPWNPEIFELEARLAGAMGKFQLAANRYRTAARLSQRPWLDRFQEARVLANGGAREASRLSCRQAITENPGEESLQGGPCAGDLLVSSSPARTDPAALDGARIARNVYIFATAAAKDVRIRFFLDDPNMDGAPTATESNDPYDFVGTLSDSARSAEPFDTTKLTDGEHTLTAAIRSMDRLVVVRARFFVSNSR